MDYQFFKNNFEAVAPKLLQTKFTYKSVKFDLLSFSDLHFKFVITDKLTLTVYMDVPRLEWNQHRRDWKPNEKGNWKLLINHDGQRNPIIYTLIPVTVDEMMPRLNRDIPKYKRQITRRFK